MSTETLFEPPISYLSEAAVIAMLVRKYTIVDTRRPSRPHRYAVAEHVPSQPFGAARICDFMALDCQQMYGPHPHPVHGFEIKASRADWRNELRQPDKAEAFKPYCDHWWLVVTDRRIVRDGELPDDWGLLTVAGSLLRVVKRAPRLTPQPWPKPLLAAFTRAVARTARADTGAQS